MTTEGERIAANTKAIESVNVVLGEIRGEMIRTRDRLHKVEGFIEAFVAVQREARRGEERQYQRLGTKIALASMLMLAATIVEPFIYHAVVGG